MKTPLENHFVFPQQFTLFFFFLALCLSSCNTDKKFAEKTYLITEDLYCLYTESCSEIAAINAVWAASIQSPYDYQISKYSGELERCSSSHNDREWAYLSSVNNGLSVFGNSTRHISFSVISRHYMDSCLTEVYALKVHSDRQSVFDQLLLLCSDLETLIDLSVAPTGSMMTYSEKCMAAKDAFEQDYRKLKIIRGAAHLDEDGQKDFCRSNLNARIIEIVRQDIDKERSDAERRFEEQHADWKARNKQFLVDNKKQPGVTITPSGLQYEVVREGTNYKPGARDRVCVFYEGSLIDGTIFDSAYQRGEPIKFGLNQVIAGWTEALQLMGIGGKFRIYIPYELGYGDRQAGTIPPYSTLIFDIELLNIEN